MIENKITLVTDLKLSSSVLYRWWEKACISSWIIFICFQICIQIDHTYSKHPLCPHTDEIYPKWYWTVCLATMGGFICTWIVLLTRLMNSPSSFENAPTYTAFNVVSMGTLATVLSVFFNWGGVCIDVLGVASPAAIWGEWCACGPLLIFITVTMVDKPELSWMDWFLMTTFFICLITGFLIIIPQPYGWAVFWLVVSCLTYLPLIYLPFYVKQFDNLIHPDEENIDKYSESSDQLNQRYAQRYNVTLLLTFMLPLYTVNYLVALFGGFDAAQTIAVYQVLSVFTKAFFAAATMNVHLNALRHVQQALIGEKEANEMRREYLKNIFHKVRTPLNSLTMGIDILEYSNNFNESDRESLLMMKGASDFMCDTLNDVQSMQKIEEGKLELSLAPFSLREAVTKVFSTFHGTVIAKDIVLKKTFTPNVPSMLVGDRCRIEHVISNLLSNAIKFSSNGMTISVNVTADSIHIMDTIISGNKETVVTVTVSDQGPGISAENQRKLFGNFVQIQPGEMQQGQGSGLGLLLCKQLVTLHGGTIGVTSSEGKGSSFFFSIPLVVCESGRPKTSQTISASMSAPVYDEVEEIDLRNSFHHNHDSPTTLSNTFIRTLSTTFPLYSLSQMTSRQVIYEEPINFNSKILFCDDLEVLIVDDNDSNLKMLKMLLVKHGVTVTLAVNGQIAVDLVIQDINKFAMVIMDNLMPVMGGMEAAKEMRRSGFNQLIIGITGQILDEDMNSFIRAGADLVLGKPLQCRSLKLLLHHIQQHGTESRTGMRLVLESQAFVWKTFS